MARRFPNPGFINPVLKNELDTQDINAAAAERQKQINDQAAQSYENWRQAQIAQSAQTSQQNQQDLVAAKTVQALSAGLGMGSTKPQQLVYNPSTRQYEQPGVNIVKDQYNPATDRYVRTQTPGYYPTKPNPQQLQQNFQELTSPQQLAIAQRPNSGIDPAITQKLIQGRQEQNEKITTSAITNIADDMSKGNIIFDPKDRKFYRWQADPTQDISTGIKKKVELGPYEYGWLHEGMSRGMIPDLDNYSKNPGASAAPSDLQNVASDLGQPQIPQNNPNASVAALGQALAATKTDVPYDPSNAAGNSSSTMSLTPTGPQPSNMQLGTNYGYQGTMGIPNDPSQMTPAMMRGSIASSLPVANPGLSSDAATAAGQRIAQFVGNPTANSSSYIDNPAIAQASDNASNDIRNFGAGAYNVGTAQPLNAIARFVGGTLGAINVPQLPIANSNLADVNNAIAPTDTDAARRAAFFGALRAKQLATQPDDSQ